MTVRDMLRAMDNEQLAEFIVQHLLGIMLDASRINENEVEEMRSNWVGVYQAWLDREEE